MQIVIDISEKRYKDILRIADVQLESKHFQTAEQIIATGTLLEQEPTTKNDSPKYCDRSICLKNEYNNVGCEDCEVTKSQEPTTKNDLGIASELEKNSKKLEKDFGELDCIDRQATLDAIIKRLGIKNETYLLEAERVIYQQILAMPSVTPQEPQSFRWCTDCKEYDHKEHCCHRYSKVIRDTVEEMKQEQEPFINKSCISSGVCEHDKNKVLDKIRAEIVEEKEHAYADFERYKVEYLGQDWEDALDSLPQDDFRYGMERTIEIIDKYKTEQGG